MSAAVPGTAAQERTGRTVPTLTGDGDVVSRLRTVVQAQPDAVAVTDRTRQLTFAELAREAAATLATIRAATTPANGPANSAANSATREPVALLHSHDAGAVAALAGVLASGHPVLVLDPRTPAPRLKQLLERVDVRFCVADGPHAATAAQLVPDVLPAGGEHGSAEALWLLPPDPSDTAVLAFTSGSTGRPKVVANDHRMIARDAWANSVADGCYGSDDVIAHTLPMGFHAGLLATIAGLLVGCTMKLYDIRGEGIGGLAPFLGREGATMMYSSPAILRALLATGPDPADLRGLRSVTIAGETVHAKDVAALRAVLPATCTVRNRYGSSETGLIAELRIGGGQPLPDGALPVGRPPAGSVITLVDEAGRPVERGEPGTVTVTARWMATGYWQDAAATAKAFRDNPDGTRTYTTSDIGRLDEQGRLELLGRRDHSVKIRGYLVEPGEVDAVLHTLPDVREAVVVGRARELQGSRDSEDSGDGGQKRLVAYVVSSSDRTSAVTIRSALHESLPGHMVPETVVFLEALPRTDRGKLDRSALPEPPAVVAGARVEDLGEWESVVAAVWERVLALDVVGPDDDFFELGGDSLAAERLMAALVEELGVPASEARTSVLAQAPTLSEFSSRIVRKPGRGEDTLIPLQADGERPPLFLVAGAGGLGVALIPLAKQLGADQPVYALQAHALERRGLPDWSVRAAARRHVRSIRRVQPEGPYHVGGHSFGGLVALEIAHQLRAAGQEVALLVVLDSFPPEPSVQPPALTGGPVRRLRIGLGLLATGLVSTPGLSQYWRFHRQSMLLGRRYRCAPWSGRTLVVVADSEHRDARADWGPHLSGPWETLSIDGDHLSMMREPYVSQIGTAVTAALRE